MCTASIIDFFCHIINNYNNKPGIILRRLIWTIVKKSQRVVKIIVYSTHVLIQESNHLIVDISIYVEFSSQNVFYTLNISNKNIKNR